MSLPLTDSFDQDYDHDTLTPLHFGVNIVMDAHLGVMNNLWSLCWCILQVLWGLVEGFSFFWYLFGSNKMFTGLSCWSPHLPGQGILILIFFHQDATALPLLLQQCMPLLTCCHLLSMIFFVLEYTLLVNSKGLIPIYGLCSHFDPQIHQFLSLVLQPQCPQCSFFSRVYTCTLPQTLSHGRISSYSIFQSKVSFGTFLNFNHQNN